MLPHLQEKVAHPHRDLGWETQELLADWERALTSEVFFAVYGVSHIARACLSGKERKAASYTEHCNRPVLDPYEGPKICQQYSEDVGYGDGPLAGRNQRTCTIRVSRPHNLAAR